jgi:predicted FMN-binding regulatory protein PaiB
MLNDSLVGLAIAIFVISSVAWVSQWRRIRNRMRINKAIRAERHAAATTPEWPL